MIPKPSRVYPKVPEGWYTRADIQIEWNLAHARTLVLIKEAMRSKRCEMKKFLLPTSTGSSWVPHYKFRQ